MVTAKESPNLEQFSAWNSPSTNWDRTALLQLGCYYGLPCFHYPSTFSVNGAFPPDLSSVQPCRVDGFFKQLPPLRESSSAIICQPYLKDSQYALAQGPAVGSSKIDASDTNRKKFLIVDQSANNTRLFFNPTFSPSLNQFIASKTTVAHSLYNQKLAINALERRDENDLTDGGSEMHEDTDEINALLYSDSDDDADDADGENDEVTSKMHTSFSIGQGYDKEKQFEELIEDVASSDGSTKRQRLFDGRHKISSFLVYGSPLKPATSSNSKNDAESNLANKMNSFDGADSTKRAKKVKIRETLKILESIIPGLKGSKDPLSIIDKGIDYLKTLKLEAEALGVTYP